MTSHFVLIVEDDDMLGDIFAMTLRAAGFTTETIKDGRAALTRLAEIVPDMVLLDLHLPYVSGAEVLRQIRADNRLARIKVIVTTAK